MVMMVDAVEESGDSEVTALVPDSVGLKHEVTIRGFKMLVC